MRLLSQMRVEGWEIHERAQRLFVAIRAIRASSAFLLPASIVSYLFVCFQLQLTFNIVLD